ncbi:Glutathione S-transferase zeta-1 [Borealophlyctis nickersoniae]|nr:Glutathione S-transferase zeta-1 [Borealophlyctis nickersoniae]
MSTQQHSDKPILYSYWRSTASWRVRIALAYKGIDYEYRAVNLLNGEQLAEPHLTINPNATIPVLALPSNQIITHSNAILEYLEEVYPDKPLLPEDPVERAQVRAVVGTIVGDIHPLQNLRVLKKVGDDGAVEWGRHWISRGFEGLEKTLKQTAGTCCFGDTLTLADACLVPQVHNAANRFGVDMSRFPTISKLNQALMEREEFKTAAPGVMPDAPKE